MARNPAVEARLIQILDSVDKDLTYEDLQGDGELNYVGWVVQEALRMHPVAPSILRKWHKGQPLGNNTCDHECNVGVTLPMLHMDERLWPNPEVFDPLRYFLARESVRSSHHIFRFDDMIEENKARPVTAYLPFGGGPRTWYIILLSFSILLTR